MEWQTPYTLYVENHKKGLRYTVSPNGMANSIYLILGNHKKTRPRYAVSPNRMADTMYLIPGNHKKRQSQKQIYLNSQPQINHLTNYYVSSTSSSMKLTTCHHMSSLMNN